MALLHEERRPRAEGGRAMRAARRSAGAVGAAASLAAMAVSQAGGVAAELHPTLVDLVLRLARRTLGV
jgi:hypothetical protein